MEKSDVIKLVSSLVITVGMGSAGGFFTAPEIANWYSTLNKPSFNPPNYLFGPVWSLLYILMGISLFLIWKQPASSPKSNAITLFIIQFALNIAWSFIFFNQHQIGLALLEIAIMWLFILLTIIAFGKIKKAAAWLLVPYICWVSFASVLNFAIWNLNR